MKLTGTARFLSKASESALFEAIQYLAKRCRFGICDAIQFFRDICFNLIQCEIYTDRGYSRVLAEIPSWHACLHKKWITACVSRNS